MAPISAYNEALERWTWKRQVMDDGTTKILSGLRVQEDAECALYAIVTTLELNLRVQWGRSVSLSIPHLRSLNQVSRIRLPNEAGKIRRLLLMIQDVGIFEERQYADGTSAADARRYKISKFYHYKMDNLDHLNHALYQLRGGGPLLAVIRISHNYNERYNSGVIYRFDPNRPVRTENEAIVTHSLCVVSFALEAKVPCLECQDSHGQRFGRNGFLMVDITSIIELYSIKINVPSS